MAATLISNTMPYNWGMLTNRMIAQMIGGNTQLNRLQEAIATASSGYEGTPGTEFEIGGGMNTSPTNLFGVQADPNAPGQKGSDYRYAIEQLHAAWQAFWTTAQPYIDQL